jgi:hypothetical protein
VSITYCLHLYPLGYPTIVPRHCFVASSRILGPFLPSTTVTLDALDSIDVVGDFCP